MKNFLKTVLIFVLVLSFNFCFCGCANKNNSSKIVVDNEPKAVKDYNIYIYNLSNENCEQFKNLCDYYTNETGVKIKLSYQKDENNNKKLLKDLDSSETPTIFAINNLAELNFVDKQGLIKDVNKSETEEFKKLLNDIPEDLRLSLNSYKNIGIPYGLKAYGYIVDVNLIKELFGNNYNDEIIFDIQKCSYEEFEKFVLAVNNYIHNSEVCTVTLNSKNYNLSSSKSDVIKNLEGVFSIPFYDESTYSDYLLNIVASSEFSSYNDIYNASDSKINLLQKPLNKYFQMLDFITKYNIETKRGSDFVQTLGDSNKSIEDFANHKSVFLLKTSDVYNKIKAINLEVSQNLMFVPVKFPFEQNDIALKGITEEKLNNSLSFFSNGYYLINANATNKEQKLSEDFLVWLNNSEEGRLYLSNNLGVFPCIYKENEIYENILLKSALEYKNSKQEFGNIAFGFLCGWTDSISSKLKDDYLIKFEWNNNDYSEMANYAISEWKSIKSK